MKIVIALLGIISAIGFLVLFLIIIPLDLRKKHMIETRERSESGIRNHLTDSYADLDKKLIYKKCLCLLLFVLAFCFGSLLIRQ